MLSQTAYPRLVLTYRVCIKLMLMVLLLNMWKSYSIFSENSLLTTVTQTVIWQYKVWSYFNMDELQHLLSKCPFDPSDQKWPQIDISSCDCIFAITQENPFWAKLSFVFWDCVFVIKNCKYFELRHVVKIEMCFLILFLSTITTNFCQDVSYDLRAFTWPIADVAVRKRHQR